MSKMFNDSDVHIYSSFECPCQFKAVVLDENYQYHQLVSLPWVAKLRLSPELIESQSWKILTTNEDIIDIMDNTKIIWATDLDSLIIELRMRAQALLPEDVREDVILFNFHDNYEHYYNKDKVVRKRAEYWITLNWLSTPDIVPGLAVERVLELARKFGKLDVSSDNELMKQLRDLGTVTRKGYRYNIYEINNEFILDHRNLTYCPSNIKGNNTRAKKRVVKGHITVDRLRSLEYEAYKCWSTLFNKANILPDYVHIGWDCYYRGRSSFDKMRGIVSLLSGIYKLGATYLAEFVRKYAVDLQPFIAPMKEKDDEGKQALATWLEKGFRCRVRSKKALDVTTMKG